VAEAAARQALAPVLGARAVSPNQPAKPPALAGLQTALVAFPSVPVAFPMALVASLLAPVERQSVAFRPGDSG
jgi:hypothetical protein